VLIIGTRPILSRRKVSTGLKVQNFVGEHLDEEAIMGNEQDGSWEAPEGLLHSFSRFNIEVIGQFVEEQQIGPAEEESRQGDLAAFFGAHRLHGALRVFAT